MGGDEDVAARAERRRGAVFAAGAARPTCSPICPTSWKASVYAPHRRRAASSSTTRARAAPARGADRARRGRTPRKQRHAHIRDADEAAFPAWRCLPSSRSLRQLALRPGACCSKTTEGGGREARRHHGIGGRAPWKPGEKTLVFSPVHQLLGPAFAQRARSSRDRAFCTITGATPKSDRVRAGERVQRQRRHPCSWYRLRPAAPA